MPTLRLFLDGPATWCAVGWDVDRTCSKGDRNQGLRNLRFGVISDVHGNLHALRAAIRDLRLQGVDEWLSVGDLIGYGPFPNECTELVAELGAVGVAGNHELIALGLLSDAPSSERAKRTHRWTAAVLRDDVKSYLASLPRLVEVANIVLTHGALGDPQKYVNTRARALEQLTQLKIEHPAARCLVLGHTHRQQLAYDSGTRPHVEANVPIRLSETSLYLLNPGSVGQSRQWEWPPLARAALLDVEKGLLTFREIDYDVRGCIRAVRGAQLPYRALHSPPALWAPASRRARDLDRRLRGKK